MKEVFKEPENIIEGIKEFFDNIVNKINYIGKMG